MVKAYGGLRWSPKKLRPVIKKKNQINGPHATLIPRAPLRNLGGSMEALQIRTRSMDRAGALSQTISTHLIDA